MFRRLLLDHHIVFFTVVAFVTSASIYGTFLWRALRMKRPQLDHFANLPFDAETPVSRHES